MPAKKKLRTEAQWEFELDGSWKAYDPTDAAMLEKEYVARQSTGAFETSNFTFNVGFGTKYTVDFDKMSQLNQASNNSRAIRRVAAFDEVCWEYIDDNGLFVQFYDADTNEIESLYRDKGLNTAAQTKKLSWNKGYNSMYTYTFTKETADAKGMIVEVVGTQKNEDSGKVRQLKRTPKKLPWAIAGYGISGDKDALAQLQQAAAAAAGVTVAAATAAAVAATPTPAPTPAPAPAPVAPAVVTPAAPFVTPVPVPAVTVPVVSTPAVATPAAVPAVTGITSLIRAPTLSLPPYWEKANLFDALGGYHEFILHPSNPKYKGEYETVAKLFNDTIGKTVTIMYIMRLENAALYSFYAMTRMSIASGEATLSLNAGGKGTMDAANEKLLFTGERIAANMNSIKKFGFDLRVAPADGAYGQGLYLGAKASFADNGRCIQNPDGSKDMIVCRVTVGSAAKGTKGIRRSPLDPKKPTMALYDSCVDDMTNPQTHVIFNSKQVYAEYLVRYM